MKRQQPLNPFYPIFDDIAWLPRVLPLGVKLLQLRIKDQPVEQVREQLINAKSLCNDAGCQLIVNDYWQLAMELRCNFIHLGQEDLDTADVPAIQRAQIKLGISTHSEEELERALALQPDYIALGPVYPTLLKKMPWQPQGLDNVMRWKKRVGNLPLVAIGGMSLERADGVFNAGADSVALVTDITLNENPEAQIQRWLSLTSAYSSS